MHWGLNNLWSDCQCKGINLFYLITVRLIAIGADRENTVNFIRVQAHLFNILPERVWWVIKQKLWKLQHIWGRITRPWSSNIYFDVPSGCRLQTEEGQKEVNHPTRQDDLWLDQAENYHLKQNRRWILCHFIARTLYYTNQID